MKVNIQPDPDDLEMARAWLVREIHITQPGMIVAMGEEVVEFVNALRFPLSVPMEFNQGIVQSLTPTIDLLAVPDLDGSLNDAVAKRDFWTAFKVLGEWYDSLPPY